MTIHSFDRVDRCEICPRERSKALGARKDSPVLTLADGGVAVLLVGPVEHVAVGERHDALGERRREWGGERRKRVAEGSGVIIPKSRFSFTGEAVPPFEEFIAVDQKDIAWGRDNKTW